MAAGDTALSDAVRDGIRCMLMRGGTSKGAYFVSGDIPADAAVRDDLLLRIMGSPDPRQIDGIGGAHPLTSKVAIVSPSADAGFDVDYLFLQVVVDEPVVSDAQTCGNLLAGIGPFAVERGLVPAGGDHTTVRIRLLNTGDAATAVIPTPDGRPDYAGDSSPVTPNSSARRRTTGIPLSMRVTRCPAISSATLPVGSSARSPEESSSWTSAAVPGTPSMAVSPA